MGVIYLAQCTVYTLYSAGNVLTLVGWVVCCPASRPGLINDRGLNCSMWTAYVVYYWLLIRASIGVRDQSLSHHVLGRTRPITTGLCGSDVCVCACVSRYV